MHYYPVTPIEKKNYKIEDLLEYGDMENCPYSLPQAISKAYNFLNKTGKFRESIKSWNHLPPVHKIWIAFKTHFRESHLELTGTGELTLEEGLQSC